MLNSFEFLKTKKEKFQLLEKRKIEADFNKKIVAIFIKNKKRFINLILKEMIYLRLK